MAAGKTFEDYVDQAVAWVKSRPANFLYGFGAGFLLCWIL